MVSAVLGKNDGQVAGVVGVSQFWESGQRGVAEGGVLVGVDEIDVVVGEGGGESFGESQVQAWPSSQAGDGDVMVSGDLGEGSQAVEGDQDRPIGVAGHEWGVAEVACEIDGEHFGTGAVETVEQVGNGGHSV